MDQLVYPTERRTIALDFDATASTNIPFWQNFVKMATGAGYDVYMVTARSPDHLEEPKMHFGDIVKEIIATSHKAKLPFCQNRGLRIDIFIDDSPWNVYLNIDGSSPKFESLDAMHPDYGTDIANLIFPRNHSLKLVGYGFYYTDCKYEVPLIRKSFHRTKKGAYLAMRKFLQEAWDIHWAGYVNDRRKLFDKYTCSQKRKGRWYGPFEHAEWAVMQCTFELHE